MAIVLSPTNKESHRPTNQPANNDDKGDEKNADIRFYSDIFPH